MNEQERRLPPIIAVITLVMALIQIQRMRIWPDIQVALTEEGLVFFLSMTIFFGAVLLYVHNRIIKIGLFVLMLCMLALTLVTFVYY